MNQPIDSLSGLFKLIRDSRRPTVDDLESVTPLTTLRLAGLRAMCLGTVPTREGQPRTTIATDESQVLR